MRACTSICNLVLLQINSVLSSGVHRANNTITIYDITVYRYVHHGIDIFHIRAYIIINVAGIYIYIKVKGDPFNGANVRQFV